MNRVATPTTLLIEKNSGVADNDFNVIHVDYKNIYEVCNRPVYSAKKTVIFFY